MKSTSYLTVTLLIFLAFGQTTSYAQKVESTQGPVYVDSKGVLRWQSSDAEAAFFGVNYSTPFAFAYRAHKALGVDIEQAIQDDVYHMARLGFDAFRVHVWDTEISDVEGNLLENEHLRLFDFLLAELKKRNIKTIITPIAFWGNGYPEPDEDTPGFSNYFGRGRLTTDDSAIVAQEVYLKQFFEHVNPYTKLSYGDDPDVIAVEVNNEPSHSGPKSGVTEYINRLHESILSTGFSKPIFYNISQGPDYADAVAKSNVDGFSFQWYPSGLVSGKTMNENFLPHINKYAIPFDSIPEFNNRPLMVYEFDAADIMKPYMYPAMARSFRQAGFQWATQFAYEPLAIAHTNTEYQTHYMNLAYTPDKAISMLIASKAFHQIPLRKSYGSYSENSRFENFMVSHEKATSEMNSEEEFYYAKSTSTKPKDSKKLKKIAGVGSSPLVEYSGNGAYFLDHLDNGVWRLEVMPDAIHVRDPFARTAPDREVTRIQFASHMMTVNLPDLSADFVIQGLNDGNALKGNASNKSVEIEPGTYLLTAKGKSYDVNNYPDSVIGLNEFVAPTPISDNLAIYHQSPSEISSEASYAVRVNAVGIDKEEVILQYASGGGRFSQIPMEKITAYVYEAKIPSEKLQPGSLSYRFEVKSSEETLFFPGNERQSKMTWASERPKTYEVFVAHPHGAILLFDSGVDTNIQPFPTWDESFQTKLIAGEVTGGMHLQLRAVNPDQLEVMGFQYPIAEKIENRIGESNQFSKIVIKARVVGIKGLPIKVGFTLSNGGAMTSVVNLDSTLREIEISIADLQGDKALLLPRPYPGFMPLFLSLNDSEVKLDWEKIEKIQVAFNLEELEENITNPFQVEIEKLYLKK